MAVRIRLTRVGATKRPAYRVIAIDQRRPRDGRALEILGYYDPLTEPATVQLQSDRISAWIGKGAQPSDTVVRLMRQAEREAASPPAEKPKGPAKSKGIVASSPKPAKPKAAKPKAAAAAATATATAEESAEADTAPAVQAGEATEATAEASETPPTTDATDTAADAAADSAVEPAVAEEAAAEDAPAPAPDGETEEPKT